MQTKPQKYTAGGDQVTKAPKVALRERKERTAQKTENLERIISRREARNGEFHFYGGKSS